MKKILVTGCCGFIGSHLVEHLSRFDSLDILGIDDLSIDEDSVRKVENLHILRRLERFRFREENICKTNAIEEWKPDIVVHLAGLAGVRKSLAEPEKYIQNNVFGHTCLLKQSIKNKVKKFIYASSSSVYGSRAEGPFYETDSITELKSPYALTKFTCEKMSEILAVSCKTTIVGCRFFSVYGPRGRPDMAPLTFYRRMMQDQPIEIFGDGSQKRDFTFVLDVVEAITRLLFSENKLRPIYNIGCGKPVPILRLVQILEHLLNKKAHIKISPKSEMDVPLTHSSNRLLHQETGFMPRTNLSAGIKQMIDYYHSKNTGGNH